MFNVVSYNIKCGSLTDFDFSPIGEDIKAVNADIAGIQEVDRLTERNGNIDTMPLLAKASGLAYHGFAPSLPFQGGHYGIGYMSRFKPEQVQSALLPGQGKLEPRVFICVKLSVENKTLYFINTHLSYENTEIQQKQMKELGRYLHTLNSPFVLTGDFNTENFELFSLLDLPVTLMNNSESYFPSFYPDSCAIDNIIISNELKFIETGCYTKTQNSDHHMIYAKIDFI